MDELGWPPNRRWLPSIITLTGAIPALWLLTQDDYSPLIWIAVFHLFCDDLDGMTATLLNARSRFGQHLDDLSDSIVQSIILALIANSLGGAWPFISIYLAIMIMLRTVQRTSNLSRLNWGIPTNDVFALTLLVYVSWDNLPLYLQPLAQTSLVIAGIGLLWPKSLHIIRTRLFNPFVILGYNIILGIILLIPSRITAATAGCFLLLLILSWFLSLKTDN